MTRHLATAPSLAPGSDVAVYLVLDDFGRLGRAYVETDEAEADAQTIAENLLSGHDYTKRYTTIAEEALRLPGGDFVIDGEMVVPRADGTTDFFALSNAVSSHDSRLLQFRAFDILFHDGKDVRRLPLIERKALL